MVKQCPQCGSALQESVRFCPQCGLDLGQEKKPDTAPDKTLSYSRWYMRFLLIAVLVGGLWAYLSDAFRAYHPVIEKQPSVIQSVSSSSEKIASTNIQAKIEGPFIVVQLKEVLEKRIVRFSDPEGIQPDPMIAYLTPSGKLVTAMSKSENCHSTDFYLEGENIHCASCPSYWNMSSLEAYACCQKYYPDPIPSTIVGDEVRIESRTVREWKPRS